MNDSIGTQIASAWAHMSGWEVAAVLLAIAYLVLAVRQHNWCWYCALASTAIYTVLFWDVQLLMESALNVYYMLMAAYGWWQWRYGGAQESSLSIQRWGWQKHTITLTGIALITAVSGFFMGRYTQEAWPFVDSFTTWASVITTYMVARKVLENWLYWMVINSTSIFLYTDRGLYLTTFLLVCYLIISVFGWYHWYRAFKAPANHNKTLPEQAAYG